MDIFGPLEPEACQLQLSCVLGKKTKENQNNYNYHHISGSTRQKISNERLNLRTL